jgi:predicted nucleic acid-binding protein
MAKRVYFDTCCLNRPFDDQSQARIRLETEAVIHLLRGVEAAKIIWINSDAIVYEVLKCPDEDRRSAVLTLCTRASEHVTIDDTTMQRARELRTQGVRDVDALHLACAEKGEVEVLLTTDNAFRLAAGRLDPASSTRVMNPVTYEVEEFR